MLYVFFRTHPQPKRQDGGFIGLYARPERHEHKDLTTGWIAESPKCCSTFLQKLNKEEKRICRLFLNIYQSRAHWGAHKYEGTRGPHVEVEIHHR